MKRIATLLLLFVMLLSLVACGGESTNNDGGINVNNTANNADQTKPSLEETTKEDEPLVMVKLIVNNNAYSEYIYDETGRVIQELTYFKGELSNCYVYTYTEREDGTTLLRVMNDVPTGIGTEYLFDATGNCVKRENFFSGNTDPEEMFSEKYSQGINVYEYDDNNRLITVTYTNTRGDGTIYTYAYDENGHLVNREEKGLISGTVIHSEAFKYDSNGYLIRKEEYSATYGESASDYEWIIRYDERKNIVKEGVTDVGHVIDYEYTEDGSLLSITVDDTLTLLPDEMYISNGHLVNECEHYKFVLMPLSKALAQQSSAE